MRVILYMAATANGVIARADDDTSFTSKVDWEGFRAAAERTGNIMVGRRTYEIMMRDGEFDRLPPDLAVIVLTSKENFQTGKPNHFSAKLPQEALLMLEHKGMAEALLAGGGSLNSGFMEENLIDEIYLDLEPWIIGKGIRLFEEGYFEAKLRLVEMKKLSDETVQLHYQVVK